MTGWGGSQLADLPAAVIDRASPVPFYWQLKRALAQEIAGGRWTEGDRVPSEPAICEHFSVSRTTVRQALAELETEGMIRRERGRGTFIAEARATSWLLQSSHGFYDEAVARGQRVRSKVLRAEPCPLPAWAADALEARPGSTGAALERLRWVDERLVMYVITYLTAELAGVILSADLENGSLYRTLEETEGVTVYGGRRVVEAVTAQGEQAGLLEIEPGAPLLFVESVSWDSSLRPFECYRAWHRAEQTRIEVQVIHERAALEAGLDPSRLRISPR
jgi:GntR family transcriptional regulator